MNERPFDPSRAGGRQPDTDYDPFADERASLGAPTAATKFQLIPFRDIAFSAGARWLIKGLLPSTGLATIYGPPKQYKSFIAADVGLHIAAGLDWAGRRVRQGVVIYLVGEGQTGFADRIAANRQVYEYRDDLPFFLVKARPNLGTGDADRLALVASIEEAIKDLGLPLSAVFIDTLVRTLAGASENDEGMRNFTDNAEAIADHFGCLAVAVHHTGKDVAKGMRGSSALHGAVVMSWRVEKSDNFQARITIDDSKDSESGLTWTADLERFVFCREGDEEEESVLFVRELSEPVPEGHAAASQGTGRKITIPVQLRNFMACIDASMSASGRDAKPFPDGPTIRVVPLEAVRAEYFTRRGDEATADAKRKAFVNSQKIGVERRLVVIRSVDGENVIWPVKAET